MDHPDRDSARRWLAVFSACGLIVTGLMIWTLLTPPFQGDLTRLGRLSETEFGPTLASAALIGSELRQSSALPQADIVVIGDSFSEPLLWQSVLTHQGLKVATLHWRELGPLCRDFGAVLRAQGFQGSDIIIESVERGVHAHLAKSIDCEHTPPRQYQTGRPAKDWQSTGRFNLNTRETLLTGLITTLHTHRARQSDEAELINSLDGAAMVRIQQVPQGCQVFSHRLCRRGLFFADDRTAPPFSATHVAQMQLITGRHSDLAVTWLILPNKSTVYLTPERSETLGAALPEHLLGPDMFARMAALRLEQKDLYSPNDTHTSIAGHLEIGRQVLHWLQERRSRALGQNAY
jgi:hypothetical protein